MEDNTNPRGYYTTYTRVKPGAMPPDGINKIAYYDDDYETVTEFVPVTGKEANKFIRPTDSIQDKVDAMQQTQEELVLAVADIIGGSADEN